MFVYVYEADLGWDVAGGTSTRGTVVRLGDDQARTGRLPCVEAEAGAGAGLEVGPWRKSAGTGKVENGRPRPMPVVREGVLWWLIRGGEGPRATRASLELTMNSDAGDLGDV